MEQARAGHYQKIVVILEHHPFITSHLLARVFDQLTYEDDCLVVGPTTDGRCYLVGMKANHADLFEPAGADPMGKADVLLRRICSKEAVLFPIAPLAPLDTGYSIAALIDAPEVPERTSESLKKIGKKYRVKHPAR